MSGGGTNGNLSLPLDFLVAIFSTGAIAGVNCEKHFNFPLPHERIFSSYLPPPPHPPPPSAASIPICYCFELSLKSIASTQSSHPPAMGATQSLKRTLAGNHSNLAPLLHQLTTEGHTYSSAHVRVVDLSSDGQARFIDDVVTVSLRSTSSHLILKYISSTSPLTTLASGLQSRARASPSPRPPASRRGLPTRHSRTRGRAASPARRSGSSATAPARESPAMCTWWR